MPRHIDELIAKYGGSPSSKSKRKVDRARHVGERVQGQDCSAEGIAIKQHREAAARRGVAEFSADRGTVWQAGRHRQRWDEAQPCRASLRSSSS